MNSGDTRPFQDVISLICGSRVIRVDRSAPRDTALVSRLTRVAELVMLDLRVSPIVRSRPNEVGNDVEAYVARAIAEVEGLESVRMGRATGYPDIMVHIDGDRWMYIECKTYSPENKNTSFRSFYLSPSRSFKVDRDAIHVAMSFCMVPSLLPDGRTSFSAVGFKVIDLYDLPVTLKSEWNSSNRELYSRERLLVESDADTEKQSGTVQK